MSKRRAQGAAEIEESDAPAVGDVVKLVAGGPNMTVREVRQGLVATEWTDGARQAQTASFPSDSLRLVRRAGAADTKADDASAETETA
ncbi:DUF2158 domain-containing protein [Hansschlegelia zhihuaiae]|uniref:DUF2158 domain-containing protein n=1 Tax=Hansschlegelia zhihuaiae TaxID=405005 RepID=A0A4Q0MF46_9HYPH|nr:DUF2158 domain-containing protein [Hansschlegelia zhihuaiae]RXF72111.1 DUF2158 domain-containing protein [Hansschlegelia zhihuaiae]